MAKETNTVIARALLADLQDGKSMQTVTASLAAYLVEERRIGDLNAILRDIERQLLVREGKLYVHATTAHALDEAQAATIKQIFAEQTGAKDIVIEETINKDVIGGVRLQTADHQLDLTVRRQLQRLKIQTV